MRGMLKADFYRYSKNMFFWLIVVFMLGAGIYTSIKALSGEDAYGYTQFFKGMESPFTYFAFIAVAVLLSLMCFNTKSLQNKITYASRTKVYFAQTFTAIGLVLIVCMAQFITVSLPGLFLFPFGRMITEVEIGAMAVRFGLFCLVCIMQASLLVFLGAVCYKSTRMVTAYILYEIICFLLSTFLFTDGDSFRAVLWSVFKNMYAFKALYTLSNAGMSGEDGWRMLIVVIGMILLWLGLGLAAFSRRKEL